MSGSPQGLDAAQAFELIKLAIDAIVKVATAEHGCDTPDGNKVVEIIAALGSIGVREMAKQETQVSGSKSETIDDVVAQLKRDHPGLFGQIFNSGGAS